MSVFASRESVETAIEVGKNPQGEYLAAYQVEALKELLSRRDFDDLSIGGRRSYFERRESDLRAAASHSDTPVEMDAASIAGWIMAIVGVVTVGGSFALKTSVSSTSPSSFIGDSYIPSTTSDVINIGLLQTQMMVLEIGLAAAIAGVVLIAAAMVRKAVGDRAGVVAGTEA